MSDHILTIEELCYTYQNGRDFKLQNLNLKIERNSITSVLGRNGVGKTTLLLLILGFLKPSSGDIRYHETTSLMGGKERPHKIAFLPQIESAPLNLTVGDYLLMGRLPFISPFTVPSQGDLDCVVKYEKLLNVVHLHQYELGKVSGGELQRVRLGRALVQESELILLDEPITHLDVHAKYSMMALIENLQSLGKTIIFTTHDPVEALNISDYSMLIEKDSTITFGKSADTITSQNLSKCFDLPIEVVKNKSGYSCVIEKQ